MSERQWGPCEKHGADLPCAQCRHIVEWERGGNPLIVRRFTCTTCQGAASVRLYRENGLSVTHDEWLLAKRQHPPTDDPRQCRIDPRCDTHDGHTGNCSFPLTDDQSEAT